jgi:hypothetical protein
MSYPGPEMSVPRARLVRALAAILLAGALGLLVAGCGDGAKEKNAYVEQVNGAQKAFAERFDEIQSTLSTTSTPAEDRRALTAFGQATDKVVRELRGITPPGEVQDLHARLIAAVASYGQELRRAQAQIRTDDATQVKQARTDLSTGVRRVQERIADAVSAINAKLQQA